MCFVPSASVRVTALAVTNTSAASGTMMMTMALNCRFR